MCLSAAPASGAHLEPLRAFGADRVAAGGLFARALIAAALNGHQPRRYAEQALQRDL